MNFLNPGAFFLSLLLPLIIMMYFLRLRRAPQPVSSTYLWQKLIRDVEANAPWQKLRKNLLLILQLLFLLALILSITNPFILSDGSGASSMIIILDTSASMAATDANPSRLEAAKQQAHSIVENAPENTRTTIISAGENTQILVSSSQDKIKAQQAINSISTPGGISDLSTALEIAAAISSRQSDTDIILLSDGRITVPERVNIKGNLVFYPIGLSDDNQGITNIQLEQNTSGNNDSIFVQVKNFGSESSQRRLEIYVNNSLFDAIDLQLDAYQQKSYFKDGLPINTDNVEAKLIEQDYLPQDDIAWAVAGNDQLIEISLVTDGNRFLETALSLLPNIELTTINISNYDEFEAIQSDLVIFDGLVPSDGKLPQSNLLFIAPTSSNPLFNVGGVVDRPLARPVSPDDPIMKNISFDGVNILKASAVTLPTWATISLTGDINDQSVPLLFHGTNAGHRIAVLTFSLQNSDLPIQVAFPLLIANLVNWLVPNQSTISASDNPLTINIPLEVNTVTAIDPNGNQTQKIPEQAGSILLDSTQPGIYTFKWEDQQFKTAINFFTFHESEISPIMKLNISGFDDSINFNREQQLRKLVWRPIAFVALTILCTEWMVYNRGSIAKISASVLKREYK